jgi:Hemerythrin HHE cation binding domain.
MLQSVLSKDHARIDRQLMDFLSSLSEKPDAKMLTDAFSAIKNHMFWEEEFLFPAVEKGNEVMIKGLQAEHGAIWKLFDSINSDLNKKDIKEAKNRTEALLRVIKGHNSSEENYIYREMDKLNQDQQAELLLKEVESSSSPRNGSVKS